MRYLFSAPAILLLITGLGGALALASGETSRQDLPPLETPARDEFREWQILDTRTGHAVSFEVLTSSLLGAQVVYLGEEHRNRSHIEAALKVLHALDAKERRPILAMEMFAWDGQDGLDRYVTTASGTREQFLRESRWEQNWGGSYVDYEPLIIFARDRRLAVLALNPPRPLVRRVAKVGLMQALADAEMDHYGLRGERFPDDPVYREKIFHQVQLCHGGLPEEAYQRLYEASVFRDEAMAKTIAEHLRVVQSGPNARAGPIVSYTGGGHIQYGLPVPKRVVRRIGDPIRQVTIYMTAYEAARTQEIQELLHESIADYLWLTPVGAEGPPKRCR
jgi:uncharacterized iron-regulated protein